ncbi:VOC family protein [Candidatus Micrarchaeota archaeon]|nr:VOC family protein [Candidatus Micrarchaeota archaeon]
MIYPHHVLVWVSDMKRAIKFYTQVLGLPLLNESPHFSQVGGKNFKISLHLGAKSSERPKDSPIIVFHADDVDSAYEELKRRGVRFYRVPSRETPTVRVAEFQDSEGNRLSISNAD